MRDRDCFSLSQEWGRWVDHLPWMAPTNNAFFLSSLQANENGQDGSGRELVEMRNLSGQGRDSRESEVECISHVNKDQSSCLWKYFFSVGGGYPGCKGCFMMPLGRFFFFFNSQVTFHSFCLYKDVSCLFISLHPGCWGGYFGRPMGFDCLWFLWLLRLIVLIFQFNKHDKV